ncbi:MAG: HEAT repeat domain-containing protein, partial [Nanoarchaeota archaeon]
ESPPEKKSYFMQLLGNAVKPEDLINFIQTHPALGFREKRYLYKQFGTIGKSSTEVLLKNFGSNPEDDFMTVDVLGKLGDARAVESLCQRLESEYSSGIALHGLLNTLGRIGDSMATTYLIRFLDSDKPRNFEAVETLIQVGNHSALGALRRFRERYAKKYPELKKIAEQAEQREKQKPDFGATVKLHHYEPQELYALSFVHAYEKIPEE